MVLLLVLVLLAVLWQVPLCLLRQQECGWMPRRHLCLANSASWLRASSSWCAHTSTDHGPRMSLHRELTSSRLCRAIYSIACCDSCIRLPAGGIAGFLVTDSDNRGAQGKVRPARTKREHVFVPFQRIGWRAGATSRHCGETRRQDIPMVFQHSPVSKLHVRLAWRCPDDSVARLARRPLRCRGVAPCHQAMTNLRRVLLCLGFTSCHRVLTR